MRLIPINQYDERSMVLAQPIFDSKRRLLLGANHSIHPKYLERMVQMGISTLVVEDAISKGITLEEMLDMPAWMDVMESVHLAYEAAASMKPLPIPMILKSVAELLAEVQRRPVLLPMPTSTLAEELRPYAHGVNVALLSLQIAKALGYNQLKMKDLAVGCLLHDIGKVVTSEEKEHPEAGFSILRKERELSLLSGHIAYQHHERLDGTGYPRGLSQKQIHEYALICGLSDYYENLISNLNIPPHEALEMIMAQNEVAFPMAIVNAFVQNIPSYPPGTKVRLYTGEEAIVIKISSHMQRPVIRILSTQKEISLAENPSIVIANVC
ncbi:HD-GYP domain-containing protein [Thermicanus aegyptius]|uniref:HD-GYP domain-containing protein n=1 Tax=Thermicanus aegyptius TaxID=94009 RepID=UPI000419F13D|nr:HD domain-containing protein [Thermicanus aegyptius]